MKSCVPEARIPTCSLSSQCWRPVTSLDYRQEEEYRASRRRQTQLKWYLSTSASVGENDLVLVLCYRRNCIISAYYQQRETHKATLPNVSKKKMHCESEFVLRPFCSGYAPFLLFVGLRRMLRGLLDWFSKDSRRNCL